MNKSTQEQLEEADQLAAQFRKPIREILTSLLASQEPLDAEFEEVLYENLWDLYES